MKTIKSQIALSQALKQKALEEGFNPIGIANIPGSRTIQLRTESLQRWLEAGHQAEMGWMAAPRRQEIKSLLKGVQSIVAVGLNYFVKEKKSPKALSIARYAWGNDYHKIIKKRLNTVGKWLETQRPNCQWRVIVDSSPLLEKAWAEEAGIGWIGKNSNLIHPKNGSWMVIGFLLCTESLTADKPSKPYCGKCEDCIKACPTNAITQPFVVNAKKCLAYHTIENRNHSIPKKIEESLGTWIAGCDICQEVCPWNKAPIESNDPDVQPREWILSICKQESLSWSDEEWKKKLQGSALKRIKPNMWRRNIAAISKNIT